ncbi:MAG: phosphate/phosphite/phosphonate ABC transporter substrate-binding protein [Thermomicrobiales bacterium]
MSKGEDQVHAGEAFVFAFAPTVAGDIQATPARVEALRRYLERELAMPVRLIAPESYAATLLSLRNGEADAAMMGEFATRQGAELGGIEPLVAPMGRDEEIPTYRSVFVTRIDSGLRDLADLRGREIGLVDIQSTSGYLVPRAMLREQGLDPDQDLASRFYGRHTAVVDAVLAGEVVAGAVHESRIAPDSLERGPEFARLRTIARSRPIPLGPLVIRSSLDPTLRDRLARAMLRVHEDDPAAADVLIRSGHRFTMAKRPSNPTLKSIAALAGVSYVTVSRVVNGSGYVAPATAERVKAVIAEVGYVPNGNARVLQGQQAPIVGILTPFAAGDPESLVAALGARGVPLVLCPVRGAFAQSPFGAVLRDRRLGGLIVGADHVGDPELARLARTGYTILAVGVAPADVPVGMIGTAMPEVAEATTRALGLTRSLAPQNGD